MQNNDIKEFSTNEGRVNLRLRVLYMGEDICLLLDGGQRPHLGALAVMPALEQDRAKEANGVHLYCLMHHREDELAKRVVTQVKAHVNGSVTCLCGIHIPDITKEEIALVYTKAEELIQQFLEEEVLKSPSSKK